MLSLLIGLFTALWSGFVFSLGVVVQAFEARRSVAASPARFLVTLARRRVWLAGTIATVAAWLLQGVALLFAPLSVVQPALATQVVWLGIFGRRALGERLRGWQVWATGTIVLGLAGIAWAAPAHSSHHSKGAALIVPIVILGSLALLAEIRPGLGSTWPLVTALCAGLAYAWVGLATKLAADDVTAHAWGRSVGWVIAVCAVSAIGTGNEMTALRERPATQVVPLVLALEVVIPVVLATIVAGERWSSTRGAGVLLAVCVALVVAGGVCLAASTPRNDRTTSDADHS